MTDVLVGQLKDAERLSSSAALRAALEDITFFEYTLKPGGTPDGPHIHKRHSDSFFVLEGELEFQIDGRAVRAVAGTHLIARGEERCTRSPSPSAVRRAS